MPSPASKILFEIPGCSALLLEQQAAPALQILLEKCDDFNLLVTGQPAKPGDALELFADLPPGKLQADKTVIGFYQGSRLVGVLDSIQGYPSQDDWFIGLMLLDPAVRRSGLGNKLVTAYEGWAASLGAKNLQLGVVEENQPGLNFWQNAGYNLIAKRPPRPFGSKTHSVYLFNKPLQGES